MCVRSFTFPVVEVDRWLCVSVVCCLHATGGGGGLRHGAGARLLRSDVHLLQPAQSESVVSFIITAEQAVAAPPLVIPRDNQGNRQYPGYRDNRGIGDSITQLTSVSRIHTNRR